MSSPYSTIACFIDHDDASRAAVAEAARLRDHGDAELYLAHVAPEPSALYAAPYAYLSVPDDVVPRARQWIEARAREVDAKPVLLSGFPPRAACDFAATIEADLVVAAAYHGAVRRAMLGGFASYLAYHAPCPVLLMRPPESKEDEEVETVGAETLA